MFFKPDATAMELSESGSNPALVVACVAVTVGQAGLDGVYAPNSISYVYVLSRGIVMEADPYTNF